MRSKSRLVIASSLTEQHNEWLAAHPSRPEVIALATPWDIPDNAEALFTYQTQWRAAPKARPAGWCGRLKWIQVASAGVDTFPPWFFEGPSVVTRGLGVQAPAIAEYVVSAIFAHEKRFWDIRVRSRTDWQHRDLGGIAGKAVGIAGFGAIGVEIATRALPLGLRLKALTRSRPIEVAGIAQAASLDELAATCDHVVLALPLTPQTRGMVNRDCLAGAQGIHLINVARGAIIDDAALLEALDEGRVAAATLDVTSPEPLPDGHPFYSHPRIRLTPHVCGQSEDLEQRLSARLLDNLERYMAGRPLQGLVDVEHRY